MASSATPEELALRWGCHKRTVQRMCKTGELRAFRVGDLWRIPWEAVEAHERGGKPSPNAQPVEPGQRTQATTSVSKPAHAIAEGAYEPIFAGAVPWRDGQEETMTSAASSAAGRGRTTSANKKTAHESR